MAPSGRRRDGCSGPPSHAHRRHAGRSRHGIAVISLQFAMLSTALGCSASGGADPTSAAAGWQDASAGVVSRPAIGGGVTAVTSLDDEGRLWTIVFDLATGRRLWSRPSTTSGRPADLGVAPPAVAGPPGRAVVGSVEPRSSGAEVVGRDVRTGSQRWARPVGTTFGPTRCGDSLCLSEFTAEKSARFAVLDPTTGKASWTMPGVAEAEWADRRRVVVFRIAAHPVIEAHDLASGRSLWSFPVERALGGTVDLSGGWSFGALDNDLIGYLAPFRARQGAPLSAFGFFSLRTEDGALQWAHHRSLRLYPSADPAVALVTRDVDPNDRYGGFTQVNPHTGRAVAAIPAPPNSGPDRWPAFPADLSALGLLQPGHPGQTYDLRTGGLIAGHVRAWSFCTTTPAPLKINGSTRFFPVPAVCPYDMLTGRRLASTEPPPGWYTGAVDGWRVWRDEHGGLHGRHDAEGTVPGMLG
ncbi:PQQ-binding-like beta-propeller repeat protein [Actinoallomurus sp. CA-150999]|uniref:outer membrane protein assembly factor BamB family protein n=1 Tax=Actinoallomurus sp. CA-150999 TaxID=3239887 RepID=UPI003D8D6C78